MKLPLFFASSGLLDRSLQGLELVDISRKADPDHPRISQRREAADPFGAQMQNPSHTSQCSLNPLDLGERDISQELQRKMHLFFRCPSDSISRYPRQFLLARHDISHHFRRDRQRNEGSQ